jgi:hypothetical protein
MQWLLRLAHALNTEFRYRYNHTEDHRFMAGIAEIEQMTFESHGRTDFPQAMPEKYTVSGDAVRAYRN